MLIEKFDIEVFTLPCEPGAERFAATARLVVDISHVLPYLNAALRGPIYHEAANSVTWKKGGHNIVFNAYEISTRNVEDRQAAEKEIQGLVNMVNRTWERRAEITPSYESRRRPTPMAVYKLLPGTNCKQCGEPTCFTFALKLTVSKLRISDCPELLETQYSDQLKALQDMIVEAPSIG